jgi:streptothricin acetyltransferase
MEVDRMSLTIRQIGPGLYSRYADIDPSYQVTSVLKVVPKDRGLGGFQFLEERVSPPYWKGDDSSDDLPTSWPPRQEPGEFAAFLAMDGDLPLGGAAVVINPTGAFLFERRETLAGLWDIRVRSDRRRTGVGSQLMLHAADWAKRQGCTQLRVECQNVNVAACRFYAKHCVLGGVERYGYAACPDVAHEVMLLWYRDL